jgi:hypothetical protein
MIKKTLYFYSDSSHGWLKVKKSELVALGIADKISRFSYMRDEYAYLEEDCDAQIYMRAYAEKYGNNTHETYKDLFNVKEKCAAHRQSKIRSYWNYNAAQ